MKSIQWYEWVTLAIFVFALGRLIYFATHSQTKTLKVQPYLKPAEEIRRQAWSTPR
jgi:hypothetical protein